MGSVLGQTWIMMIILSLSLAAKSSDYHRFSIFSLILVLYSRIRVKSFRFRFPWKLCLYHTSTSDDSECPLKRRLGVVPSEATTRSGSGATGVGLIHTDSTVPPIR
ncbi:hypothetical protein Bca4012_004794 [Brassica carinata]